MKIIDAPIFYSISNYDHTIKNQIEELSKIEEVISIYQIGGLSTPGISDIDLVVIFKDGYKCETNPRIFNDKIGNYLFTHPLYGTSETNFRSCMNFTFFHNFKLLYGKEINIKNTLKISEQNILKEQIALEFLIKMYINLAVQKKYNTIKLRSLFLHIKALPYDFNFLNINPVKVLSLVNEGISLRNNWFTGIVSEENVINWFNKIFNEYEFFLMDLLKKKRLSVHSLNFQTAPNIFISNNDNFGFETTGSVFPNPLNLLGSKYFKALNKFNYFNFNIPLSINTTEVVKKYFKYGKDVAEYNKIHLPYFMSLTSSLKNYKK